MIKVQIDMTRYWELLDQNVIVGPNLENLKEYLELRKYLVILKKELYFRQRYNFYQLIDNYLAENLDSDDFYLLLDEMLDKAENEYKLFQQNFDSQRMTTFETDSRAKIFYDYIQDIFSDVQKFTAFGSNIEEAEFRQQLKKNFLEMPDLLEED